MLAGYRVVYVLFACLCSVHLMYSVHLGHFANLRGQENPAVDNEPTQEFDSADLEFFESKVRPILVTHCYDCHGPEADPREGGLLATSRKALLKGGDTGPAIKPGDPEGSLLLQVLTYDGEILMPPDSKLEQGQIDIIADWIKRGAPWPTKDDHAVIATDEFDLDARKNEHWCWQPIRRPPLPEVERSDWILDPLDRFVLARIEQAQLDPADPASKTTWIRRVSFDLTGLPPTPEEIQNFLADDTADAHERVVDRLLDSPHFGERWARHWMDLVRYAETCGHEFDYPIPGAHQYRDYLIRAFNADVSYDQLVREHLAGDLLTSPRLHPDSGLNESIIGTGFWFLGEATHAPVDVKGDEAGRIDNQIDVMSKTFLGITLACARCHDHKFDAISTKDYYAISGFLQSSRRQEALLDPHRRIAEGREQIRQIQAKIPQTLEASQGEPAEKRLARWSREIAGAVEVLKKIDRPDTDPRSSIKLEASVDRLLADFESGTYKEWITTGTAFGSRPQDQETLAEYQGDVAASGRFFVNSHSRIPADGGPSDDAKGTLTGPSFKIDRRFLHFLVGGGNQDGKTCVQLLIDGEPVLSQPGFNDNRMRPVVHDLSEWVGETAQFRLVDDATGGWGNIGADFFVLSHSRHLGMPRALIREVALRHSVSADRIESWVLAVKDAAANDFSHPAQPLAALAHSEEIADEAWQSQQQAYKRHVEKGATEKQGGVFLETSQDEALADWFFTGQAFPQASPSQGNWSATRDGWRFASGDHVNSERYGSRLNGVLRSPTFTIESDRIWYRLKSRDVNVRLIIDGFTMNIYNALLFSQCSKNFKTDGQWQWVEQSGDIGRYQGHRAHLEIIDHNNEGFEISEIRFGDRPATPPPHEGVAKVWLESKDFKTLCSSYAAELHAAWTRCLDGSANGDESQWVNWALARDLIEISSEAESKLTPLAEACQKLDREIPAPIRVQAIAEGPGENEQIFIRGNHRLLGEIAPRQMLTALQAEPWPENFAGSGRLRLANEIVAPQNPLASRVMVNRLWHHLFGRGLVPSVDNFGVLGQEPTHPELLDYLASEIMEDGWSIKRMIKRLVMSQTYRLSSQGIPESDAQDPENLLWHRADVRRIQGEAIRDAMLQVSGRLDTTLYGPSVPIHLTEYLSGRGRPRNGPRDGNRRRSLYLEVRRNFLQPMMISFDTPIPFSTVGRRNTSNVPAQALILMNDPFVYEEAKRFAERLLAETENTESRVQRLYWLSFGRAPDAQEVTNAISFLESQGAELGLATEKAAQDIRVWHDLCHVIWNVKEFTYLN